MKIKKLLTEVEESQRVSFTAKKSVVAEVELYRTYVEAVGGVRLKRQEIIGLMIRKFLEDERDFKRWKKEHEEGRSGVEGSEELDSNTPQTSKSSESQSGDDKTQHANETAKCSATNGSTTKTEASSSSNVQGVKSAPQGKRADVSAFTAEEVTQSGGKVRDYERVM